MELMRFLHGLYVTPNPNPQSCYDLSAPEALAIPYFGCWHATTGNFPGIVASAYCVLTRAYRVPEKSNTVRLAFSHARHIPLK